MREAALYLYIYECEISKIKGVVAAKSPKSLPQVGYRWQYFTRINAVRRKQSLRMNLSEALYNITNKGYHLVDPLQ